MDDNIINLPPDEDGDELDEKSDEDGEENLNDGTEDIE